MILAVVLVFVTILWYLLWWWNDFWYSDLMLRSRGSGAKLPPGDMGFPLIGEMPYFLWHFILRRTPDDYINAKRRKFGDGVGLYKTHLFGSPSIIACSPMVNKFIFQSETKFNVHWPSPKILGTSSLVVVQGKAHARLRNFILGGINRPESLRQVALKVQPRIISSLESWALKGRITTHLEVEKVTLENIGMYFCSFEPGFVLDTLDKLFQGMIHGIRAYPIDFLGSSCNHAIQCQKKAVEIFREEMEKRRRSGKDGIAKDDMLERLMELKDDEGNHLSDMEVLDNMVSFVLAGFESTSTAIMWAVYYLAKNPTVLHKLREENMPLSKIKNGELLTTDDIAKLKYTGKVVEETIRLANIAAFVFRTATEDVEYRGYKIPKGWKVILWIRYLHTDPNNFEDPMCFNPDRWDKLAKPGSYQVFGGGSRICAGNMLARLQLSIFLHYLATGYKWELVNPNAKTSYLPHPKPVDGVEITFAKL